MIRHVKVMIRFFSRRNRGAPLSAATAFSLIEIIAVIAIISIMLGLLAPSINAFSSTAGRNGAVNILMNTLEQARVAALESGRPVYVVFLRRIFPDQDEVLVLREPDLASLKPGEPPNYEQLTRKIKLPKNILLHSLDNLNSSNGPIDILAASLPNKTTFDPSRVQANLDLKDGERLNILAFNKTGGVSYPPSKLMLIISEGVRGHGGTEALISSEKEQAGGYEIISVRRYTGRSSLEVTTL